MRGYPRGRNERSCDMDVRGKGALITGGSQGLGAALAGELAARGARVVLVARNAGRLERTAATIRARGGEAHAIPDDVGDKRAPHRIAGAAAARVGTIEVLIHNASMLGPASEGNEGLRLLLDTECEDLEQVLQTNLIGPFRLTKIVAGAMALRGSGAVVHVSSDAAIAAYPRWGAYGVSKAALDHLNRLWAVELAGTGVRFVSVDPGEMDSEMHALAMPDADRSSLARPGDVAREIARRIAEPIESGSRLVIPGEAR